ncbi:MAG: hypothetical protein IPN71_00760 [Fibrobacteres bacterium]|nr:hypothetical protein [Fibrobacterota bacterium]
MANRAYLFADDLKEHGSVYRPDYVNRVKYYDSRHNLPVCWMFLFSRDDIRSFPVEFQGSSWLEWKLVAEKAEAIQRFRDRMDAVKKWANRSFDLTAELDSFLETIVGWEGGQLILDPDEIFAGCGIEDDKQHDHLRAIFEFLETTAPASLQENPGALGICYFSPDPTDFNRYCLDFMGATYAKRVELTLRR